MFHARVCQDTRSLTALNLRNTTGWADEGGAVLAQGLSSNVSLQNLDLTGCQLGVQTALELGNSLTVRSVWPSMDGAWSLSQHVLFYLRNWIKCV